MKRWTWVATGLAMPLAAVFVIAAGPRHAPAPASPQLIDNTTYFDGNNLLMFVGNTGSFAYDRTAAFGKNDGLYYPKGTNTSVIYAAGIWMAAKVNGEIRGAVAEYANDYTPGPMANGTFQTDRGGFRTYKINKGDDASVEDYAAWPYGDGAPALKNAAGEDSLDADGNRIPLILGDQALYAVYNDADFASHNSDPASGAPGPMGVEVQHYVFGYARSGALGNTIFMQYKIINNGENTLDSMFVSLWADPDLGDAGDDFVGCDTVLSLGFCYNADDDDASYGAGPPAVGFDFFQGPIIPAAGATDTILVDGKQREVADFQQLPMTSFNKYINGTDPAVREHTYAYMNGFERDGSPHINSSTGQVSKFFMSGDPVANTGELDNNAADRRYMMTSGPFTMNPGDTQVVVAAVVVAEGATNIESVARLRDNDRIAQAAFDAAFDIPGPPPQPSVWQIPYDNEVLLVWGPQADGNVQEAFFPGTDSVIQSFVFEGFNVYQGASNAGPWTKIATFDEVNGVQRIYSDVDNPNGTERVVVQRGTDAGLVHELRVTQDRIKGGQLVNNKPYYFAVTAYNYDALNQVPFEEFGIIAESFETLPSAPADGVVPLSQTGMVVDTAEHVAGLATGAVYVDYVDPLAITGDTYRVTVNPDFTTNLINVTDDDTLISHYDFLVSSQVTDGFVLRAVNPSPGLAGLDAWDVTGGARRFTWAGGDFGFEGFNGAMGWASPCNVFRPLICPEPDIPPDQIVNVEFRLAQVDASGNWNPDDENVSHAYRYIRNGDQPAAKAEFEPFITRPVQYGFQDYEKSVFLSAWNMDVDPPVRLSLGFLENNVEGGAVDGKYWPPLTGSADNVDPGGPREWLWVFLTPYSETPNVAFTDNALTVPMEIMYWFTAARRNDPPYSPGGSGEDRIIFYANHVFGPNDIFEFTTVPPEESEGQVVASEVANVYPVPNPYYNLTSLEIDQFNRQIKFVNLPPAPTTIRIFNLAGDLVRTLVKDDPSSAEFSWDVLTETGLPVASGMYIWHVDAQGIGTKIGKLAVFTEVEQLNTY